MRLHYIGYVLWSNVLFAPCLADRLANSLMGFKKFVPPFGHQSIKFGT